jgi:hypothetical protein
VLAATARPPHEQPPGPRQEAADHRIRDEPREVAEPERPEYEEGQRRRQRHDHGRRDDGEERLVDAAERVQRSARGDDRKHGYRRVLDASDHTAGARSPREDREGQGGRDEVDTDPGGTGVFEEATEDEHRERDREDDLDHADDGARRDDHHSPAQSPRH